MSRYNFKIGEYILDRYEIMESIGKGSYGNVLQCYDLFTKNDVALKVNKKGSIYEENVIRESEILQLLKTKSNSDKYITILNNIFKLEDHIVFDMKLYSYNLYQYMKNNHEKITLDNIEKMISDITNSINFIHDNNIIHADIKPENLIFTDNTFEHLILCDFSLSKISNKQFEDYDYEIQSIWYRAPEISFKLAYNNKIDLFSFGTIIYEIIFNEALFVCKTNKDLLKKIIEFVGYPDKSFINSEYNIKYYFHKYSFFNNLKKKEIDYNYLYQRFKKDTDYEERLNNIILKINNLLTWDPNHRIIDKNI